MNHQDYLRIHTYIHCTDAYSDTFLYIEEDRYVKKLIDGT